MRPMHLSFKAVQIPGTNLHVAYVKVTPDLAREWLEHNRDNRDLRKSHVGFLSACMSEWDLNGETIVFAETGALLDGQHRLHACVAAGTPFGTLVVWGIQGAAQDTIGTGLGRRPGDTFKANGVKNYHFVSAIAKWFWIFENDLLSSYTLKPPRKRLLDTYLRHEEAIGWASELPPKIQPGVPSKGAPIAAAFGIARIFNPEVAAAARSRFIDGTAEHGTGAELLRRCVVRYRDQIDLFCCALRALEIELAGKRGGLIRPEPHAAERFLQRWKELPR